MATISLAGVVAMGGLGSNSCVSTQSGGGHSSKPRLEGQSIAVIAHYVSLTCYSINKRLCPRAQRQTCGFAVLRHLQIGHAVCKSPRPSTAAATHDSQLHSFIPTSRHRKWANSRQDEVHTIYKISACLPLILISGSDN
jgi:hypothetical protein